MQHSSISPAKMDLIALRDLFQGFKIDDENTVLEQCQQLCETRNMSVSDLFKEWEIFTATNSDLDLSDSDFKISEKVLKKFKDSLFSTNNSENSKTPARRPLIGRAQPIASQSNSSFSSTFGTPLKRNMKPTETTVQTSSPGFKIPSKTSSQTAAVVSTSTSLNEFLPSGFSNNSSARRSSDIRIQPIDFSPESSDASANSFVYALEPLRQVQTCISQATDELLQEIKLIVEQRHNHEQPIELSSAGLVHASEVWMGGRILHSEPIQHQVSSENESSENESPTQKWELRIDQNSVILAGYPDNVKVQLDLTNLDQFSVFPGQVVLVRGVSAGSTFLVSEWYPGVIPRVWTPPQIPCEEGSDHTPLTILLAGGPFVTSTDLYDFGPLGRILEICNKTRPTLLLLGGPFLDEKHTELDQVKETFDEYYSNIIKNIVSNLPPETRLVLTTSLRDTFQAQVFPQPSYDLPRELLSRTKSMTNPFMALLGPVSGDFQGVTLAMSTADALMDLSRSVYAKSDEREESRDRMADLAGHLLSQRSFYPLYPPYSTSFVNLQPSQRKKYAIDVLPEILISQSALAPFARQLDSCSFINPGQASRGHYAEITIHHQLESRENGSRVRVDLKKLQ